MENNQKRLKTMSSKLVLVPNVTREWISASQTRNYIIEDPICDYLDMYGNDKGILPDNKRDNYNERLDFVKFIMNQGNLYEKYIMDLLENKSIDIHEIPYSPYRKRMENTLKAMKDGNPFIYQGMIFNPRDKTFGIPDLLVRSDYINTLVPDTLEENETTKGCNYSDSWHYRVVDIKFTTLKLKADGIHLLNAGSQKAYKSQLSVYNNCLSYIQGYNPHIAYILGRGYEYTTRGDKYMSSNPFEKMGTIDFDGEDNGIIEETENAINWRKRLLKEGASWSLPDSYVDPNGVMQHIKASVPELYPNMCVSDCSYSRYKKELANKIDEITLMYQCGKSNRELAHLEGVYSYKKAKASMLGINGGKMGPLVDKFIEVNNGVITAKDAFLDKNVSNWKYRASEVFIDFETISSIYDVTNNKNSLLYLIGAVYEDNYRSFLLEIGEDYESNLDKERVMIEEFLVHLITILYPVLTCPNCNKSTSLAIDDNLRVNSHHICECTYNYCPTMGWWDGNAQCGCDGEDSKLTVWHYSGEEATRIGNFIQRLKDKDQTDNKCNIMDAILERMDFVDLYKVIKEEEMIIKGMLDFSLKTVVKTLNEGGKISIDYNTSITSGVNSIMACISSMKDKSTPFKENPLIREVVKYNEVDCRTMSSILEYMRKEYK